MVSQVNVSLINALFAFSLNVVFNTVMDLTPSIAMDRELIDRLGGPAKVAELLGFDKKGGVQRVHNWKERGIPPAVKLAYPEIFLVPAQPEPAKAAA